MLKMQTEDVMVPGFSTLGIGNTFHSGCILLMNCVVAANMFKLAICEDDNMRRQRHVGGIVD